MTSEVRITPIGGTSPLPRPKLAGPLLATVIVITLFFGAFGSFAMLAPLDSAAIAPGTVTVDGHRKTVQHLEGGIVETIAVAEGDRVEAGQRLISLDRTIAAARLTLLQGRYLETMALIARLDAEQSGAAAIDFPAMLSAQTGAPRILAIQDGQRRIFAMRQETMDGQIQILRQKIRQLDEEIGGLRGKIAAENRQLALLGEQSATIAGLVDQGLARRPQLLEIETRLAEIEGNQRQNQASIARAEQGIAAAELQIVELGKNRLAEVVAARQTTAAELFNLRQRIHAAEDVFRRTVIKAPMAGTVVDLRVHSPGGVIDSGQKLMDIVPDRGKLVVLAKLDPQDVDMIAAGLVTKVRFTAFNQRSTLPVDGVVTSVSADRLTDADSGRGYYLVKVEIDETSQAGDLQPASILPGMQAEVVIITGAHTLLTYMLEPISRSLNRAFRES